ncbi:MAG: thioredoxin [Flavobacteriales bacterium]|nr:thioredoxin [Flavobacteriales bacterium]
MANFNEIINSDKPVLIDFHATWCGPCKMMGPILQDVSKKIGGRATILKVDVDKNPKVAAKYQIQGVPTLMIFKKGKMLWRQSGVVAAPQLISLLEKNA